MCGILVSQHENANNFYIQKRGPDYTHRVEQYGYHFTHNLLHVTGLFTPQPFIEDDIVCLYNGEIYNQPFQRSDGETLIPLYRQHGEDFVRLLDGELAIALYDFGNRVAVLCTDVFGTKPLWRNGTEVASYYSGVGGRRIPPNCRVLVDLDTGAAQTDAVYTFDFDHQFKDAFDDWIAAFERAVAKRAQARCFIALSSGYDSGAIDCALTKIGIPYQAYSIMGRENLSVLNARKPNGEFLALDDAVVESTDAFIRGHAEPYTYQLTVSGKPYAMDLFDDPAVVGHGCIYALARSENRRVCLSGQGADEIMADYAKWPFATEFNGHFPEPLHEWRNFRGNYQIAYLTKEEHIAGAYGIETRYPFLDNAVVQEFLWLQARLKNSAYKAPLHEYFTRHDYP